MGSGFALDLSAGIPNKALSREQRIILDRRLRELRDAEGKARKYYVSFVDHLCYIEQMQNILANLKGELINAECQLRLDDERICTK